MVMKTNRKWQMYVDFTYLNKVCLKDSFSLPKIDILVDFIVGFKFLSSLDANFRYHQIPLHMDDDEKTSFIIEEGTYCYRVMPFGQKNARATYQ